MAESPLRRRFVPLVTFLACSASSRLALVGLLTRFCTGLMLSSFATSLSFLIGQLHSKKVKAPSKLLPRHGEDAIKLASLSSENGVGILLFRFFTVAVSKKQYMNFVLFEKACYCQISGALVSTCDFPFGGGC
jgi:hypothetical protein